MPMFKVAQVINRSGKGEIMQGGLLLAKQDCVSF